MLMERLSHVSPDGEVLGLGSGSTDAMAVDADEPSAMDAQKENGHEKRWVFRHEVLSKVKTRFLINLSFCSLFLFSFLSNCVQHS